MVSLEVKPSVRVLQSRPCLLLTAMLFLGALYAVYGSQSADGGQSGGQSIQVILQPNEDTPEGRGSSHKVLQAKDTAEGRPSLQQVKSTEDAPTTRNPTEKESGNEATNANLKEKESGNDATNANRRYFKEPENAPSDKIYALRTIDAMHISKSKKHKLKHILEEGDSNTKIMLGELADATGFPRLQNLSSQYKRRFPEAIIIGCKKCGTTFLREIFRIHSKIAMRDQETHFFDRTYIHTSLEVYRKKMSYSFPDQITAEKTPRYWITQDAPLRIYRLNPHMKLVLIVRDPACRVVSDYNHDVRSSVVNRSISFREAFTDSKHKALLNALRYPSIYDLHMQNWLNVFPLKQIMVIRNEDLRTTKAGKVYRDLEEFLGLSHELDVEESDGKVCVKPRYFDTTICSTIDDTGSCKYDAKFPDILTTLRDYLRPHVAHFEKLINREFHWF
jgi:[heparan sulfate]-glucosamine 3-sulfotransferase 5